MRTDKTQKGTGYYKINYSFKRERLKHIKKFKGGGMATRGLGRAFMKGGKV